MTDTKTPAQSVDDPELRRIVGEEEKILRRVGEAVSTVREVQFTSYDRELIELRDAIGEARMEDVPALMAEMERMRNVASRRAEVPIGKVDVVNPYFGHLRLQEGARARDVLIGNSTYVDVDQGVRIVDWRDAPVSRIYYRYSEDEEYEEEFGGKTLEGRVTIRRAVVIRDGELKRVVAPQGVFYQSKAGWQRGGVSSAKLEGGQATAVRPPTEDERREAARNRGRLGAGVEGREDKHLPEIPALIDPRQFELITKPQSGLVVIQGGAGSGKTTIGLHRMAFLAFNQPKRFSPDKMMVVVFNRALASYIARVLPSLGVDGVSVTTFETWIEKQRTRHLPHVPRAYHEDTPSVVSRVKKHPMMLRLMADRIAREEVVAHEEVLAVATRNEVHDVVERAWKKLDGNALARRLTGLSQWLRAEREIQGVPAGTTLGSRVGMELQKVIDRWQRRARDVVWDWAELITDAKGLREAAERYAEGAFTLTDIATAVRWSSERCTRWVVADVSNDDDNDGGETKDRPRDKGARRKDRAEKAERPAAASDDRRRFGEDEEPEELSYDTGSEALREDRHAPKRGSGGGGGGGGGGGDHDDDRREDVDPRRATDGRMEDLDEDAVDPEDDALLMRLYELKRGPLRGAGKQPLKYEHLFIDEAQDLSPVELAVLLDTASEDRSVTLAGDTAQRLLMDNGFSDWRGVLSDLGLASVEVEPLRIGYRSTREVLSFARAVLGPLAEEDPPLATRSGAPVELHAFTEVGAAVAFLAESLRSLAMSEPRANVAIIARDAERADVYYRGLERSEVPRLSRVRDQDFSFRPGVEVTDIRQVKGLEFDYVILVDVTMSSYPVDDESRHLLHIGSTRAAHQLWVISAGPPSALLPGYLIDDA